MTVSMTPLISALESEAETSQSETESVQEPAEITLEKAGVKLTLPSDYYYCYDENIDGYEDYFTKIGWDYDDTVETFETQGIELFAFDQTFMKEFYVIVEDQYQTFRGENLKNSDEYDREAAYNMYYSRYFGGTYSMLEMYDHTEVETDQAWFVSSLFTDYTDMNNPVPVAEYWTVMNGYSYRFMLYGATSDVDIEFCESELQKIMETVEFTNVLSPEEVDERVASEERAEAFKIAITIIGTLAAVAVAVIIIVFVTRRKDKKNEQEVQKK